LLDFADDLGLSLSNEELEIYAAKIDAACQTYDFVDAHPDNLPEVKYPRGGGAKPAAEDNPLNAWAWKVTIQGRRRGPLAGKTVAIKDNVCVAGVPMMNGASTLEGYVPEIDATIVTRILDAGGTILGKAVSEYFCISGGSHTSAPEAVHNPRKHGYSAGGSSSGSAALVGAGEVDMAVGGDQGGSIRIPASFSGICGMKPTHGLVPYSGIMPIELTIDHTGPMTANVADNALMLEALAGEDGLDPRQYKPKVAKYTRALGKGVKGLRIGVLKEGFGHPNSEADVDKKVKAASRILKKLGAKVSEVSVPAHYTGATLWTPLAVEGLHWQMMRGNGFGMNWKGLYVLSMMDRHAQWRQRSDEISPTLKMCMLMGEHFIENYNGRFYGKCQNIARTVTAAYDAAFNDHDLLLMPTLPIKATKLPGADADIGEVIDRALEMLPNTCPFDITGHPAMSIPCGKGNGLPIGLMLVGPHYGESTIYQAAHAFEQAEDWTAL
jgi:amidase